MAHVRKQIRDALETLLTGLTTTGSNVEANRVYEVQSDKLPALNIIVGEEDISRDTQGGTLQRFAVVVVECYAAATTGLDDTLDQIVAEVETAVGSDPLLGGLLNHPMDITGLEPDLDGEATANAGILSLEFSAGYRTARTNPETSI